MNRRFLFAGPALALVFAPTAWGQGATSTYPTKPIRLVIPFAPGGASDTIGRLVSAKMADGLGQKFVVENRGGGGTLIGTEAVVRSAPDGYSLLLVTPSFTINPGLRKLPYDSLHDLVAISLIGTTPLVMVVHPSLPVRSVKELIALARSRPNELVFASAGAGSPTHLGMELLRSTGARMTHVPYKGAAPAAADLLGGHVQLMMTSVILVQDHIRSGRLRAIGVTTAKRSAALPDVPAMAETVDGYEVVNWWGFVAPAGTPSEIIRRLQVEAHKAVHLPEVRERMHTQAAEPAGSTPKEFEAMLASEVEKWTKVIREIGMRPE